MSVSLKLVQLNIEGSKHLDTVIPFLREQRPDVLCLQELWEHDIPLFETALAGKYFFTSHGQEGGSIIGTGIFSRWPFVRKREYQYGGSSEPLPSFNNTSVKTMHDSQRQALTLCEIEKEGELFQIGTTHFPVTEKGEATDFQREDMRALLSILESCSDVVLAGDFNAPRGGEIFSMLAGRYKDNVPAHYETSIDGNLHRAGPIPRMVDGIFSTPGYVVSNVSMHDGVSDHCALIATVSKNV